MKKLFLSLSALMFCTFSTFAQTPYDNFAPEQSVKAIIELPETQFRVANTDSNSKIRRVEFNKNTSSLNLLDKNDNVIKTVMFDPNEKKFLTMDPFAEKYYNTSPYAFCLNNPIRFIDPDGREVIGVTRNDAANVVEDLRQMFEGNEFSGFRELIVRSGKRANGKRLASISSEALTAAFDGINLTDDQQALVDMTVNTINSVDKHFIEYVPEGELISSKGQSAFWGKLAEGSIMSAIVSANGGIPVSLIAAFGGEGATTQTSRGTHSIIIGNNHLNGRAVTTGHELIGHGRSLAAGRGHDNQHVDAVQTENLILRIMGINYINDGSTHGPGTIIPNPSALPGFR